MCPERPRNGFARTWWTTRYGGRSGGLLAGMIVALIGLFGLTRLAVAVEPVDAFLDALHERGYYDEAIVYLDRLRDNPHTPDQQRTLVEYYKGLTYVRSALNQRRRSAKSRDLRQAQKHFEQFRARFTDHPMAPLAETQLGTILLERARMELAELAESPDTATEQRRSRARELFTKAHDVFAQNEQRLRAELEKIPKDLPAKDVQQIKLRDRLRSEYVQSQFLRGLIGWEQAQCWPEDHENRRADLQRAAEQFAEVARKYRRRLVGLTALLYQAKCQLALDDPQGALGLTADLLDLPTKEPAWRSLRTRALAVAVAARSHPKVKEYRQAIDTAEAWLKQQRVGERRDESWLELQYELAKAYLAWSETDDAKGHRQQARTDARRMLLAVSRSRTPLQQSAQRLLADLGATPDVSLVGTPPKNFAEALKWGQEAVAQRQLAADTAALLENRLANVADASERKQLTAQMEELLGQRRQSEQRAVELFEQALRMSGNEASGNNVSEAQLNTVRYYLSTLYYYQGRLLEATVLGDFLARYAGDTVEGRRAASVALAALVKLRSQWPEQAPLLAERVTQLAQYMASRWAGQTEANDALATLVSLALERRDFQQAEQWLNKMAVDSPRRAMAQIVLGQTWLAAAMESSDRASEAKGVSHLQEGIKNAGQLPLGPTIVSAATTLAHYYLQQDKPNEALQLLEHPQYGAKTLADRGSPLVGDPRSRQRAYTLTLLAYAAALRQQGDSQTLLARAATALAALQDAVSGEPDADRQMATIYVTLARSFQDELEQADASRRAQMSQAFQQLLSQAAQRSQDIASLGWIADAYRSLASSLQSPSAPADDQARMFLKEAARLYETILQRADSGEASLKPAQKIAFRNRLAITYRDMGEFSRAMESFTQILRDRETQVYAQLEAARALRLWGERTNNIEPLEKAIRGDGPLTAKGKNLIWGFGRLARNVASARQLRDLFFEARWELARSRMYLGRLHRGAERKTLLEQAERDLLATVQLYPDIEKSSWRDKYDQLLKEIQQTAGKSPTGLVRRNAK